MRKGQFWAHKEFKDVFVEVLDVIPQNAGNLCLLVRWWNKGQSNNPFPMSTISHILVYDLHDWYIQEMNERKLA